LDILTILCYYLIISLSFSISTFVTYIRPSIKIARNISDSEENILGTNIVSFTLEYIFWCTLTFPFQLWRICTVDSEVIQDRIIETLLGSE